GRPGDARLVFGDTAVVEGGNLSREHGDRFAVGAGRGQRFEDEPRGILVFGALRQVHVQGGWRLPVQDLQLPTCTAARAGCGRFGRGRRRNRPRRGRGGGRWWGGGGGWVGG